ncbi:ATP-binding protein [Spirosoma rhododendri]|uniref:AAA family ATPase n=1 Tax=Spirosoma rhododendri TaxID=2728024 RepID=A0A7L5DJB1_9BACT|nr:ATP-binding protein [Spirosoma rhododendri]QJD77213.1 AAA family ATPase [Spirosoma rhododendri]
MKLKSVTINDYHQFARLKLDLTYPIGHKKAGQPLEKICIIGQSGTGKTSLLSLIKNFIKQFPYIGFPLHDAVDLPEGEYKFCGSDNYKDEVKVVINPKNSKETFRTFSVLYNDKPFITTSSRSFEDMYKIMYDKKISKATSDSNYKFIYYPADVATIGKKRTKKVTKNLESVDFSEIDAFQMWAKVKEKLTQYREVEIQKNLEISKVALRESVSIEEINNVQKEFLEWQREHPSPVKILAEKYLNKFLNKFGLAVRTSLDFERKDDIEGIKIETLNGEEVPNLFWSTGTQQVVITTIPLFTLSPVNSVIFFDEPERSLYPDVQTEIVDFYTSMAPSCQFFFATHSPLVASSFEPWEVIELKFDAGEGIVYQEQYFEGERHVDNYFVNPRLLPYEGILTKIFDLDQEASPARIKSLMRLAQLEKQLKMTDLSHADKQNKLNEYRKLGQLLGKFEN